MKLTIPSIGARGVVKDAIPHELPIEAFSDVLNIRMRDGCAEKMAGDIPVFNTPPVTPYGVNLFATNSANFVVYAGLAAVYVDDGTTQTDITGTAPTGADFDRWTGGTLNGVMVLNNGVDKPMFWNGDVATNLATLTGWTATWRCKSLRPFKNYLIGLNWTKGSTVYPHMVKWSAAADPGAVPSSWNEADPSNDAGEQDLSETAGVMVDGLALGDTFIIYKSDAMHAMTYIGGQYIWQFRKLPGEEGMLARGCGCNIPNGHMVLTSGDLVIHSGQGPKSIISGKMRKWLFNEIDSDNYRQSFVVSNPAMDEAWVCFPENGSAVCTKALVWNWRDDTFSIRALPNVTCATSGKYEWTSSLPWSSVTDTWETWGRSWNQSDIPITQSRFLLGTTGPLLLGADIGTTYNGSTYTARVERKGLIFSAQDRVKLVRAVFPRIDGTTGGTVYIQVGGAMDAEGDYTWSDPVPYVIGTTYRADTFASGRFIAYRVYSISDIDWRIKSLDFDYVMQGRY